MPFRWALPNPAAGLSRLMDDTIRLNAEQLKVHEFDLIITNTIVLLIGAELALHLQIPNIIFAQELINADDYLKPVGVSVDSYIQYLDNKTSGWLACSNAVKKMLVDFGRINSEKILTFYPHTCSKNSFKYLSRPKPDVPKKQSWKIILIGDQSNLKNPVFGLYVLNLLRQKGHEVHLDHFGRKSSAHDQFISEINIQGLSKFVHLNGWSEAPLNNATTKCIHLVTSNCESFGLTIPECISAGIPVISSRCGGPEELLPNNCLYDVGDIANCATLVENIMIDDKQYQKTMSLSRSMLGKVLNDRKQIESLGSWAEMHFAKNT